MNRNFINILIIQLFFVLFTLNIQAQEPVTKYYYRWKTFSAPLILDSLNNLGKAFSVDDFFNTPKINNNIYGNVWNTDVSGEGTINLGLNEAEDYNIFEIFFNINLSKREKVKIEVFCNAKTKISIDGKTKEEKDSAEDTINEDNKILIQEELEPGSHVVGIGVLCLRSNIANNSEYYKIKTLIYQEKENSTRFENLSGLTLKTMLCGENPYSISMSKSGKYYMVKYNNRDEKGNFSYRTEVRKSSDDKVVFTDNKINSYQWKPGFDLLYYKDKNKLYVLNPENNTREIIFEQDYDMEGSIYFCENSNDYLLVKNKEKDNTSEDLHRLYLPDDRIPGWRDRTELYYYGKNYNGKLFHTYHSIDFNDMDCKGNNILFSVSKTDISKRPFSFNNIYQYNISSKKIDTLIENDGFVSYVKYSLDGKNIILLAGNEAFNSIGSTLKKNQIPNAFNNSVYLMDLQSREIIPVGKNFNPNVQNFIVRKNNLYLTCENKDSVCIYRYNLRDNRFYLLNLEAEVIGGFDISEDESQMVYYGENYNKPKRVFHAKIDTGNYKVLEIKEVFFPKKQEFERLAVGKMENFSFRMHNSNIDGRLYYPSDFDSTKQYPLIVYYYGGCSPTDRSFEMRYSAWLYTQQDYIVYVINPSGTTGWGQEFASRHVNAWGDYTAEEIIEGVKRVCKTHNFIDKKHIGCMGASYGGFMTQYLQTKTDIFACAISHAGISNITSYWGEGYWGYSYSGAASADSYPWNNPDLYVKHSPLFNADKIHTPLLLLHGSADTNVPIGESIQMYNALKILNREVEFVTVKGENHGITDFEKRLKWNNTIYAWFAKWLKEDSSWWDSLYPKENY